eukprot:TRINITY_DN5479_c0_g1_i1.p1 TRINITY_DN5479_c0_g1~~TRINITY_DN5479_c0_g1_i1.p1  ORF type:complete len:468 (+),score=150.53 TRINITY_DN5479_c0_g1_i1:90-1406(+)
MASARSIARGLASRPRGLKGYLEAFNRVGEARCDWDPASVSLAALHLSQALREEGVPPRVKQLASELLEGGTFAGTAEAGIVGQVRVGHAGVATLEDVVAAREEAVDAEEVLKSFVSPDVDRVGLRDALTLRDGVLGCDAAAELRPARAKDAAAEALEEVTMAGKLLHLSKAAGNAAASPRPDGWVQHSEAFRASALSAARAVYIAAAYGMPIAWPLLAALEKRVAAAPQALPAPLLGSVVLLLRLQGLPVPHEPLPYSTPATPLLDLLAKKTLPKLVLFIHKAPKVTPQAYLKRLRGIALSSTPGEEASMAEIFAATAPPTPFDAAARHPRLAPLLSQISPVKGPLGAAGVVGNAIWLPSLLPFLPAALVVPGTCQRYVDTLVAHRVPFVHLSDPRHPRVDLPPECSFEGDVRLEAAGGTAFSVRVHRPRRGPAASA